METRHIEYLPSYDDCYVCGQNHPRGLRIRFFTEGNGYVQAWFHPDATQTGYDDIVHGGVVSALLDELVGWSISLKHGLMAYTAELTIRFVKPLHAGLAYLASANMLRGRGRFWEAEGRIVGRDGELFARANGKYFLLTIEQTLAVANRMNYQGGDLHPFQERSKAFPKEKLQTNY